MADLVMGDHNENAGRSSISYVRMEGQSERRNLLRLPEEKLLDRQELPEI